MVRTQISLDKELYGRAKRVAKRHGVSFSELCRQGIAEIVARESSNMPWMRYAGIVEGEIDDSASVDEVVYGREQP
jgi:cytidylate kinase